MERKEGTLFERVGWVGLSEERRGEERRGVAYVVECLCIGGSSTLSKSVVERD